MNFLSFFLVSILLVSAIPLNSCSHISELFETWCKKHGRTYSSEQEKQRRLQVFEDNYAFITRFNSMGNASFTLSLNVFADLTHDEFKANHLGFSPATINLHRRNVQAPAPSYIGDIPDSLDWRDEGAVTDVKDQYRCDAPWAFAAVGAIEGINKIVTGSLVSLSEKELIDCDTYDNACNGGVMDNAYQFVIDNHGIDSEEHYPYVNTYECNKKALRRHIVTIDGYADVPANNETLLLQAVAAQPVSAGICAEDGVFQFYRWGIFDWPCSTCLDHAVVIVGYGSLYGVDYWIAKNSWGRYWGAGGYIYLKRNTGNPEGLCGINMLASYPIKTSPNPPPPPPPFRCDIFTFCEGDESCCCSWSLFGICILGNCCEYRTSGSDYPFGIQRRTSASRFAAYHSECYASESNYCDRFFRKDCSLSCFYRDLVLMKSL